MKKFAVVCQITGVELERYFSLPEANERAAFFSHKYEVEFAVFEVVRNGDYSNSKNLAY